MTPGDRQKRISSRKTSIGCKRPVDGQIEKARGVWHSNRATGPNLTKTHRAAATPAFRAQN
jgi:hypothetical protein